MQKKTMADDIVQQQQQQQNKHRSTVVPHIEVVNEIQIVVANKKEPNPRSSSVNVTTPSDNKDIRKCVSSRSSKTDITAVTTATLDTTNKNVTIKNERRASKDKSEKESGSICVCGKLLKRVKELLERKEAKTTSELGIFLELVCCFMWCPTFNQMRGDGNWFLKIIKLLIIYENV